MLELFNLYQNEIIAALAIILVIVLYIIIKKKQKKPTVIDDPYDTDDTDDIMEDITQQAPPQTIQEIIPKEETTPKETIAQPSPKPPQTAISKAIKKEVPPHGKIHKEDFKEFANKRILLAEDNIINQKVILGLLADSDMNIVVANDGQEVLDILQNDTNFMLILMDAHMPRIDGFEATRQIRANPAYDHIAVIALSGDTASDDIKKMYDSGMEGHLEKPLKMDLLYDVLYTYSDNNTTPIEEDVKEDISVQKEAAVLDPEDGLEVCGNDKAFYAEILNEFVQDYNDSSLKLQQYINNKNFDDADKLLLDVVGITANVGAKKLHNTAQALKTALKENPAHIKDLFLEYHKDLKDVFAAIREYVQK